MADASASPDPAPGPERPKKQAVLLIHGIGEQRPMATLWKLVDLVWTKAPRAPGAPERKVFSEPDEMSGVFELRRLSTNFNAQGKRSDFFEFYWAHLMHGNELADVLAWLGRLALQRRAQVPPHLHKPWMFLRVVAFAVAFFLALGLGASLFAGFAGHLWPLFVFIGALAFAYAGLTAADQVFFSPVLGDAARYLRPAPNNIVCRQQIREQGLKLLESLHQCGKYDRIILVGHSLGGVIAYELALLLWGRRNRMMNVSGVVQAALANAEAAALALEEAPNDPAALAAWRAAQSALYEHLRDTRGPDGAPLWLISDLVTLGSPLAHAPSLLADTPEAFAEMLARREVAACPPQFEIFGDGARRFSYCRAPGQADDSDAGPRAPHNSAVFAATRWSNIFFPMQGLLRGDLIGGPVAPVFGPGVEDIAARAPYQGGWFPHMHYFLPDAEAAWGDPAWLDHRRAIRRAVDLEREAPASARVSP